MQICRFCGKLIPTETRYDPGELCICKTCEEEHRKQNEKVAEILKERIGDEGTERGEDGASSQTDSEIGCQHETGRDNPEAE